MSTYSAEGSQYSASDELIDPWCDRCFDDKKQKILAHGYCQACNVFLCKSCEDFHGRFLATKQHDVIRGTQMPKSQSERPVQYPDCIQHPGYIKDQFCSHHGELVCRQCVKHKHNECLVESVSAISDDIEYSDINSFKKRLSDLHDIAVSVRTLLESFTKSVSSQRLRILRTITDLRDKAIAHIQNIYADTVSVLNKISERNAFKLLGNTALFNKNILALNNAILEIDEANKDTFTPRDFLKMQNIAEKMRQCQQEICDIDGKVAEVKLHFELSRKISSLLASTGLGWVHEVMSKHSSKGKPETIMFPDVSVSHPNAHVLPGAPVKSRGPPVMASGVSAMSPGPPVMLAEAPVMSPGPPVMAAGPPVMLPIEPVMRPSPPELTQDPSQGLRRHKETVKTAVSRIKATKKEPLIFKIRGDKHAQTSVSAIAATSDGTLLIPDYDNRKVKLFSPNDELLSFFELISNPTDVALFNDQMAAVSVGDIIFVYDISKKNDIFVKKTLRLKDKICGMTSCQGRIVVSTDSEPESIQLIDQSGKIFWAVENKHLFEQPRWLATSYGESTTAIIVTNLERQTIAFLDSKYGDIMKVRKIEGPNAVTVDSEGNIFVCKSGDDSIIVWNADLTESNILLSKHGLNQSLRSVFYNEAVGEIIVSYYCSCFVDRFQLSY